MILASSSLRSVCSFADLANQCGAIGDRRIPRPFPVRLAGRRDGRLDLLVGRGRVLLHHLACRRVGYRIQ